MEVEEIKKKKGELEIQIKNQIVDFIKETGTQIEDIKLDKYFVNIPEEWCIKRTIILSIDLKVII